MLTRLGILVLVLSIGGCAAPPVQPEFRDAQRKIVSAQDWESLASRTADRVLESFGPDTFYIAPLGPDSPFAMAFKPMLEDALLARGASVSLTPNDAPVLNIDANTYYYANDSYIRRPLLPNTLIGAGLGTYLITDSNSAWTTKDWGIAALVAGPVFDLLEIMGDTTDAEVVINVSFVNNSRVLFRHSEVFYIEPNQAPLYWSAAPKLNYVSGPREATPALQSVSIPLQAN